MRHRDAASPKKSILYSVIIVLLRMKTFVPYFRSAQGTARLGFLLLICSVVVRASSFAATATWSGAGGDYLWSNPANWTGGALPGATDDVVIDVPGDVTVRMNAPHTTVRSLQCQESFFLESGPFTVTNGTSVVNGAFGMKPTYALAAVGPATVFTVNGPVTNLWMLQALNGAVVSIPTATELTFGPRYPFAEWSASVRPCASHL